MGRADGGSGGEAVLNQAPPTATAPAYAGSELLPRRTRPKSPRRACTGRGTRAGGGGGVRPGGLWFALNQHRTLTWVSRTRLCATSGAVAARAHDLHLAPSEHVRSEHSKRKPSTSTAPIYAVGPPIARAHLEAGASRPGVREPRPSVSRSRSRECARCRAS